MDPWLWDLSPHARPFWPWHAWQVPMRIFLTMQEVWKPSA